MKYWQTASAQIRRPDIRQEALSEKENKLKIEKERSHNFQREEETEVTDKIKKYEGSALRSFLLLPYEPVVITSKSVFLRGVR